MQEAVHSGTNRCTPALQSCFSSSFVCRDNGVSTTSFVARKTHQPFWCGASPATSSHHQPGRIVSAQTNPVPRNDTFDGPQYLLRSKSLLLGEAFAVPERNAHLKGCDDTIDRPQNFPQPSIFGLIVPLIWHTWSTRHIFLMLHCKVEESSERKCILHYKERNAASSQSAFTLIKRGT